MTHASIQYNHCNCTYVHTHQAHISRTRRFHVVSMGFPRIQRVVLLCIFPASTQITNASQTQGNHVVPEISPSLQAFASSCACWVNVLPVGLQQFR